ncbi:GGDEF domain-containing protein [Inconstantimicrobium mannanitabidum]|uniref:Uncharacterized protein n=1 Tax=Inconstantimicrobium mannanitabidum TaxID=1604901 RepID=A0ACB5RG05_9CLOT|nr:GGDEF domain-containing protein [Clostridium sp. TW13]GKX68015.1 hypothetical protein rsdtw13_32730 [Clostridium sp. TW13]
MNLVLRIDNNIIAIIVSILFLKNISNCLDKQETKNRVFVSVFALNAVELVIETFSCIINRQPYMWLMPISTIFHVVLYVLGPIITYAWYVFSRLWIDKDAEYKWKDNIILLIPIIINTCLAIVSPIVKLEFYVDKYNVYQRGALFFIPVIISFFYLFYSFIMIYVNRHKLNSIEFFPLLLFGVFPSIASLIQALVYGVLLMWSSIAYSLIILYLYLQQKMMHIDYLTGAWTRDKLYKHLNNRIRQKKSKNFSIVFIDLNDFKYINDKFGHCEGDRALTDVVSIIKSILRSEDSVTRYGGDEFVLFLNVDNQQEVESIVGRISNSVAEYNKYSNAEYLLSFSCGYELYDFNKSMTVEEYINHVDQLMYWNKNNLKANITI